MAKSSFFRRSIILGVLFGVVNVFLLHRQHVSQHDAVGDGLQNRHLRRGKVLNSNETVPIHQTNQAAFLPTHKEFKELSQAHTHERRRRSTNTSHVKEVVHMEDNMNLSHAVIPGEANNKEEKQRRKSEEQMKEIADRRKAIDDRLQQVTTITPPPTPSKRKQNSNSQQRISEHKRLSNASSTDIIFNDWDKTRYFCGEEIRPRMGIYIESVISKCKPQDRITRLWPINHTLVHNDYDGLDPIQLNWGERAGGPVRTFKDCDVPCTYTGSDSGIMRTLSVYGLPIIFDALSMEGEGYYPQLKLNPELHKEHHYLATTSFKSDIPLPYYSEAEYNIQTGNPPVQFDDPKVIKGASFIAKNCGSRSNREEIVKEMIKLTGSPPVADSNQKNRDIVLANNTVVETPLLRIESVSSCLNNVDYPDAGRKSKDDIMRSYLFHLSFENSNTDDYVTEKLWGALRSGVVPVYLGAPNIREHVPPRSVILVSDFNSTRELVEYMTEVAYNKTLYESYHTWRFQELPDWFHRKYDMTRTHSVCRICRFSWATRYGWGWDHIEQQVHDTHVPRKTCIDRSSGVLTRPMKEIWELGNGKIVSASTDTHDEDNNSDIFDCNINQKKELKIEDNSWRKVFGFEDSSWKRMVFDHDGVTDLEITNDGDQSSPVSLKLTFPIKSRQLQPQKNNTKSDHQVHWIQDDTSRIVLAFDKQMNIETELTTQGQVVIQVAKPFRLRILLVDLDVNSFHKDGPYQESHFESVMLDDFFHPLQVGHVPLHEWMVANATTR
jgi:Glycosyltransferase family 10 (fucosyltransferase) C-term